MRLTLEIETHDKELAFDILDARTIGPGTATQVPGGATVTCGQMMMRKAFGVPEALQFVIETSKDVEIALLGAWLYDKVKDRTSRITINRRTEITDITRNGIVHVLEEETHSTRK
jgi:hypothetical protein